MAPHPPLLILRNFIIIYREDKKPTLVHIEKKSF